MLKIIKSKTIVGYVERYYLQKGKLTFQHFFERTRSPKQGALDLPTVWEKNDGVYVDKEKDVKVEITIKVLEVNNGVH